MPRTPGLIIPSAYSSKEELEKDLRRRSEAAGFSPFDASDFVDEELAHIGVKGMKWGHRKKRSDEEERKKTFKNADRNRKIAVGLAVVGGAAAVGLLLSKTGRAKVTDAVVTNTVMKRQAQFQRKNNPFGQLAQKFRDTKAASVPSPDQMIAEARMAGVRNRVNLAGNRRLTDETWRNQARLGSLKRDMDESTNNLLKGTDANLRLSEMRRQLQGP